MSKKKILIVGFDPHKIQFGSERGLSAESVSATGAATEQKIVALGHEVRSWLIAPDADAQQLKAILRQESFDIILVAAGLRGLPEHTLLFERVMNIIHQDAPSASLCFNSHPTNAFDAVSRHLV